MFGVKTSLPGGARPSNKQHSDEEPEKQSFLSNVIKSDAEPSYWRQYSTDDARPWKIATTVLSALFLILLGLEVSRIIPSRQRLVSYETGFGTDLEPARGAIKVRKHTFAGGIIVNETNQFEVTLNSGSPRYVGKPTQALDDAWDAIVGDYIALTDAEALNVQGEVSPERGHFYVVPHVRHSLHCLNYLRKVAYDKWYPTIRTENKPDVPHFFTHVDHCVEILRETLQCQGDLTPVPHRWSPGKQMYIADTSLPHTCRDWDSIMKWQSERVAAWSAGKIHD
ncbi:hypothetical protein F5Y14DRAFT_437952 [Nemania sp. NC0429]|nr:hypothetical protein F5Y14DRAFT_437952 [Nemania sp. NC0429]